MVACGSGVATSSLAADTVAQVAEGAGITVHIIKCSMQEMISKQHEVDIVLTTNNYKGSLGKPYLSVFGFLAGIGEEKIKSDLTKLLKEAAG
jgi:PTS system galactitol-specific IIB component